MIDFGSRKTAKGSEREDEHFIFGIRKRVKRCIEKDGVTLWKKNLMGVHF